MRKFDRALDSLLAVEMGIPSSCDVIVEPHVPIFDAAKSELVLDLEVVHHSLFLAQGDDMSFEGIFALLFYQSFDGIR